VNFSVYIPSYKRPALLANHILLEHAIVHLADKEIAEYEKYFKAVNRFPKGIIGGNGEGLSKARNTILGNWKDEDFIFQCDDDFHGVSYLMTMAVKTIRNPLHILQIIQTTARMAADVESPVFGYHIGENPSQRRSFTPFHFRGRLHDCSCGIFDKTMRFDENLYHSTDIDITFESLKRSRLCFIDMRYCWLFDRWSVGGLSEFRTHQRSIDSVKYLQEKWGHKLVNFNPKKTKSGLSIMVKVNA
jgi:hypothetical protein